MRAQCQCGQLTVDLPGPSAVVVACHCIACQRRCGSPFGVLAQYPEEPLTVVGEGKRFVRTTDEGNRFETVFCPECGSTVYVTTAKHPSMIGVAVGAIADPAFPSPVPSVWEESMHHWVTLPGEVQHFPRGRVQVSIVRLIARLPQAELAPEGSGEASRERIAAAVGGLKSSSRQLPFRRLSRNGPPSV